MPIATALLFLLAAPAPGIADDYLVEVRAGPSLPFRDEASTAVRPRRAHVVAGDLLVAEATSGAFTLATFVAPGGRATRGWVETARLRRVAPPSPAAAAWPGEWKQADNHIAITAGAGDRLHVEGTALWGTHDPVRVGNGGIHTGELSGEAVRRGDHADYADSDPGEGCRVSFRLLGPYLVAQDNNECGGMNVTFTGIYRR